MELRNVLDVEAGHLAVLQTENVPDRLVFEPMRLPLQRLAFEISDGLPDLGNDRAIRDSMKTHRLYVWIDDGPLAGPVLAHGFATMDVATIHAVGPDHIISERGQYAVYVPGVEAIVDAYQDSSAVSDDLESDFRHGEGV